MRIGDWACENQPCEHIKITYSFQICSVITYNPFVRIENKLIVHYLKTRRS